jgi:hypothetical protein
MIFLWEQDQDNDDGLQQYVRQCLRAGDLAWFPSHTSLVLQNLQKEQEEKGEGELKEMESRLSAQMEAKHGAMTAQIEQLTKLVEQLGGSGGGGGGSGPMAHSDTGNRDTRLGVVIGVSGSVPPSPSSGPPPSMLAS